MKLWMSDIVKSRGHIPVDQAVRDVGVFLGFLGDAGFWEEDCFLRGWGFDFLFA